MDTANQRIEGQFSEWSTQAAKALASEPQDPSPVGDNDYVDFGVRPVAQYLLDRISQRIRNGQTSGTPIDVAKLLASQAHGRRIDDRHHLHHVIKHQTVKQSFVNILQLSQINVFLQIVRLYCKRFVRTRGLLN